MSQSPLKHLSLKSLLVLFIFIITLKWTEALEVLLDRNFGENVDCLSGIGQYVTTQYGNAYSMFCEKVCRQNQFKGSSDMYFLDIINTIGAIFTYPMTSYTEPYSYITVDFSFVALSSPAATMTVDINGIVSNSVYTTSTQSHYDDNPTAYCRNSIANVYSSTLVLNQQLPAASNLVVTFLNLSPNGITYLRSISISKNCTPNCLNCLSSTSCTTCFSGYSQYTFTNGPTVCEQVGVCSTSNCFSCAQYGSLEVCLKCYPGFSLNSSTSQCTANTPQPSIPCTTGEYNQNGQCMSYSSIGYYQDRDTNNLTLISGQQNVQTTYLCPANTLAIVLSSNNYQNYQCRCMIDNCVGCSNLTTCTYCVPGMKFDSTTNTCVDIPYSQNGFSITQSVTNTGYVLSLVFKNQLVTTNLNSTYLNVAISNFTNYQTQYAGASNNNTLLVNVTCGSNVKGENVNVTISDQTFITQNLVNQPSQSTSLNAYVYLSPSEIAAAQKLNTAGTAVAQSVIGTLLPIAFFGNFYMLISTIDLTGFLYYLLFINVRFPVNVFQFYGIFQNFQMAFIPNFFSGMVDPNYSQTSPPQFMQQQTDSYFLNNSGQSISCEIVFLSLYVVAKIFSGIQIKYVQSYCKRACYETWEYGGFFDVVWSNYIYIVTGVMLQFYVFQCGDSSCAFNYFLFSLWFLICLGAPILVIYIIHNNPNIKDDKYKLTKFSSIFAGLKLFSNKESLIPKDQDEENNTPPATNNLFPSATNSQTQSQFIPQEKGWRQKLTRRISRYNLGILYIRKILFGLIIVFMYQYSYAQIAIITMMNITIAAYYLVVQPCEQKYENYKNATTEFFLISVQIIIALLVEDPKSQPESERIRLGWVAIGIISFVIIWHAVGIIFDFLKGIYDIIKSLFQRRNRAKVATLDENHPNEGEAENNGDISPSSQAKRRTLFQNRIGSLAIQNVKEMPGEDEDEEEAGTNASPLQSNRIKRKKFSSIILDKREGSINNLDTFVEHSNISPQESPTRRRSRNSKLQLTSMFPATSSQQPQSAIDNAHESHYDFHSNNQIIQPDSTRAPQKKFSKIRSILES